MDDAEVGESNADTERKKSWSTAFAVTGYKTSRASRLYRPRKQTKVGLDPIYEDAQFNYDHNNQRTDPSEMAVQDTSRTNGLQNGAFRSDFEDDQNGNDNQHFIGQKRSYSMFNPRRHSPSTDMINEMMNSRFQSRRKTEPINATLQTLGITRHTVESHNTPITRAKSSIYHKGHLFVDNSGSRKDERVKRWTKLEAEPPIDTYLCCPGERKLERRGFVVLFVIFVITVCIIIGFMIDKWASEIVGGLELTWNNDTAVQENTAE